MCEKENTKNCGRLAFIMSQSPTKLFTCFSSSQGHSDKIAWESLWVNIDTLSCEVLHKLQKNHCSATKAPPPFFSHLIAHRAITFLAHSSLPCSIFPILKYIFPKASPSWLKTSDVTCSGSITGNWNGLCPSRHTWTAATRIYARSFSLRNSNSSTKYSYQ